MQVFTIYHYLAIDCAVSSVGSKSSTGTCEYRYRIIIYIYTHSDYSTLSI